MNDNKRNHIIHLVKTIFKCLFISILVLFAQTSTKKIYYIAKKRLVSYTNICQNLVSFMNFMIFLVAIMTVWEGHLNMAISIAKSLVKKERRKI